jgi:ribosome-binding protein aMBF1 (putative translation factor)
MSATGQRDGVKRTQEGVKRARDTERRAMAFGENLRHARHAADVSQEDLSQDSGVDRTAISTYERGRREPNLRTIVKLARALGVTPADLLRGL